jgi:hypothetical protein
VISTLKAAFVQGRLEQAEFETRVGRALASRTCSELAALIADIPAGLTGARPPEPARGSVNKKAVAALACATAALAGIWPVGRMIPDGLAVPAIVVIAVWLAGVLMGWPVLFLIWLDRRAGRQPGRGLPPGAGGGAYKRPASAGPAGRRPQAGHDLRHTAEAAPVRRPRLLVPSWRAPASLPGLR